MNDHRAFVVAAALLVALVAVSTAGCAGFSGEIADDEIDRSGWSDGRLQLEEDFRQYSVDARRLTEPTDRAELEAVTEEILDADDELRARFQEIIERQVPEKSAWALLRIGQGFVIFGGNSVESPIPEELTSEQREQYRELLDEQAAEFVQIGRELFDRAVVIEPEADDEVGDQLQQWHLRADRWGRELSEADNPRDGCEAVEDAWRPEAMD